MSLLVISTHPIQYHAPVYRALQQQCGVPTTVVYASDFSISGYRDREFGASFSWDIDLLSGYTTHFLSRVADGGAQSYEQVTAGGLVPLLKTLDFKAALILGYQPRFHLDAFWAVRRTGVPLLLRAEASDHNIQRSVQKQLARDAFLRVYYRQFDRILNIGAESRSHYRRLGYPEHKLIFAPYCVDTSVFARTNGTAAEQRATVRQALNLPDDQIVILISGKLVPHKAPEKLIAALRMLPEAERVRITLMFLGAGELRPTLESDAQVAPRIDARFLGFKNQSELTPYYHATDLLVLPSSGETWGLVVNEALYHGKPCIVSDRVGCAQDLVQPGITGEVFAADSVASLAAALQRAFRLLEHPGTADRCRAIVQGYSVEAAARGIARAYAEVTTP